MIYRGALVCNKADRRHVGRVEQIAWRVVGREGLVSVRWLKTGWLSTEAVRDLHVVHFVPFLEEKRR